MANYTLVPVDGNQIKDHFGDALFNKLVPYQPHLFDDIEWDATDSDVPFSGRVQLSDTTQVYVVKPTDHGFVVKKQYRKDPNESDKVLQEWGDYTEFMNPVRVDNDLQMWLQQKIIPLFCSVDQIEKIKVPLRLRAFNARRSRQYKGKITVFQSHKDRDDNREVAMKPGRAITLMFPELDHKRLIGVTDAFLQRFAPRKLTVHQSTEPDKFKLAYSGEQSENENVDTSWGRKHMAHSCMRYEFDHLSTHPVAAYASGDFEIVYTTDQDDRIASRCVVWMTHPDNIPQAGPVYGVSEQSIDMIDAYLNSIGATFSKDASWVGAKLKAIHHGEDQYVAPYLDLEPQSLISGDEYLIVSHHGDICASDYGGVLGNGYTCVMCDCSMNEDDVYSSETTGEIYCSDCYWERHFHCEYAMEDYHIDDGTVTWSENRWGIESQLVSNACLHDHFVHCEDDDEWWHEGDAVWCEFKERYISPRRIDQYFTSDWDCNLYPLSEACETTDGDTVAKEELNEDWELNSNDLWEKKQEEMEI